MSGRSLNSARVMWASLDSLPVRPPEMHADLPGPLLECLPNGLPLWRKGLLNRRLRPMLVLLRIFCFFPGGPRGKGYKPWAILSAFGTLVVMLVNGCLFGYTVKITIDYIDLFGNLHASSVSSIITGIKPLINFVNIGVFFLKVKAHHRLLLKLDKMDETFYGYFKASPEIEPLNKVMCLTTALAFFVPFAVRVVEMRVMNLGLIYPGNWFASAFSVVSLFLVPLLTVWNLVPLVYYDLMNRIVRFWSRDLRRHMKRESGSRMRNLRFYYEQFNKLTEVQHAVGSVFNAFVLFSVAWSLFTLCLTIYFCTQATSTMDAPPKGTLDNELDLWSKRVLFNIIYSLMQIGVALAYIVTICSAGTKTNESTRKILDTVLSPSGIQESESDQFQVAYFVHKMSTQYMWGMSVWRVFPLERSVFFTLVSLIITYAFLLLKLKDVRLVAYEKVGFSNDTSILNVTQAW